MASNSCCSWRSFQVRMRIKAQGPQELGKSREQGEHDSPVHERPLRGRGKFEDSVFSFLL